MTEVAKKQGMSKGCLVGLIVVGVLLILIIAISITCYVKREDIAKFAAVTLVNSIKQTVATDLPPGADTTKVDAVADAFVKKLNETPLDGDKYATFMKEIQSIPGDKKVDSAEVVVFMNAMYEYFPDIKPAQSPDDTMEVNDSTTVEDSTLPGE